MTEAPPRISAAEARFDRVRAVVGLVLTPLVLVAVLLAPMPGLSVEAQRLAAIAAMTVILWISELVPLAVSAVFGPALAVVLGVAPATQVFAPFAHPLIFLFIGGFILAKALTAHGFDRRAALWLLARGVVRGSPARALVMVAVTAFCFSMWINNTATTAMMCPIALGLCASIRRLCPADAKIQTKQRGYEEGMLISLAYAASLGGVCTPIGTAPNMIAIAELDQFVGVHFDFLRWMSFALPISTVALVGMLVLAGRRWPPAVDRVEGLAESVRRDLVALGSMSLAERRAVAVFGLAIVGWLVPSALRLGLGDEAVATSWARSALPEGVVAMIAASLLFVVPAGESASEAEPRSGRWRSLMSWEHANTIDWGTVLLLGGGLSLGRLTVDTGLADALGAWVEAALGGEVSTLVVTLVATGLVIYMTELVSNTATINMALPVVIPLAVRTGTDPVPVVLTVTMAASFAFMLPVSTPPNAIAYGTGLVRLPTMVRFGARLDLLGLVMLVAAGTWLVPLIRFW